jgi:hypothetical protein
LYRANKGFQQNSAVAEVLKRIASHYYQLKIDHALIEVFLKRIKAQEEESCQ